MNVEYVDVSDDESIQTINNDYASHLHSDPTPTKTKASAADGCWTPKVSSIRVSRAPPLSKDPDRYKKMNLS